MNEELKQILIEANTALLAASGAYKVLEGLDLGLAGLGHTSKSNSEIQNKIEDYLKKQLLKDE